MAVLSNPYRQKAPTCFWRDGVAGVAPTDLDPLIFVPFTIGTNDRIATSGSCFAQHIARTLQAKGYNYLVTEAEPASEGALDQNYGTFTARFGNIYTVRQLLQLMLRAYGLYRPTPPIWQSATGQFIDPFRPAIQEGGFETIEFLEADRELHLLAVRRMFEDCSVFVFTLGLTEGWISGRDGTVFPLAPGTVASTADYDNYRFHNFTVSEMTVDLTRFLDLLRSVNPNVKVILTVSPVPLVATYEDRHVLLSNTYSKSALRVVAEQVSRTGENIAYFPSYEIIMSPNAAFGYFEEDLREVRPEGVANVMRVFTRHFLNQEVATETDAKVLVRRTISDATLQEDVARLSSLQKVICDEEMIGNAL